MRELFQVVHEDEDLLAVNKPAGLVCHPTKGDEYSSLISRARLYLKTEKSPHMLNRLDRETSGIVVLAKTDQHAAGLRRIWEQRRVQKTYVAIVQGHPPMDTTLIDEPTGKDDASQISIKDKVRPDGAPAQTEFSVLKRFSNPHGSFALLHVEPRTGRKHQIRIHLQHAGFPIVGDKLYGGDEELYLAFVQERLTSEQKAKLILPWQALHAQSVDFEWRNHHFHFECEPEPWFKEFAGN